MYEVRQRFIEQARQYSLESGMDYPLIWLANALLASVADHELGGQHIGVTFNLSDAIHKMAGLGFWPYGVHASCKSNVFKGNDNGIEKSIPVTCVKFGDGEQELHLGYIGAGAESMEDTIEIINQVLGISSDEAWEDKGANLSYCLHHASAYIETMHR